MNIFLTSDTHYFHEKIIEYCDRPYSSSDEMNQALIDNYNSVVGEDDICYHLGDVGVCSKKNLDQFNEVLGQLNGRLRLIVGNHDYNVKKYCAHNFEWVKDYYEFQFTGTRTGSFKKKIVLSHYPFLSWNGSGKEKDGIPYSYHFHGHCHGNIDELNKKTVRLDVGVDSMNYRPVALEDAIDLLSYRIYDKVDFK